MKDWFLNNWFGVVSLCLYVLSWLFYYLFTWVKKDKKTNIDVKKSQKQEKQLMKDKKEIELLNERIKQIQKKYEVKKDE